VVTPPLALAVRRLSASRSFTLVTVTTLALGIGVNAVLFSLADAVMFRPFPFADQERLVIAGEQVTDTRAEVSYANFVDWRRQTSAFTGLAAMGSSNWTMALMADEPVTVPYRAVSWDFFTVLGAGVEAGRDFSPEDDQPGAARVVVISHGFWQRQFGGDPNAVGRVVRLGDRAFTVVGVMPREFAYPPDAEAWTPLVPAVAGIRGPGLPDFLENRDAAVLHVVGRLRDGVGVSAAREDLNRVIAEIGRAHDRPGNIRARLEPLIDELLGPARSRMWALLAAVAVLLLVAAANVAGLMLARAAARRRDFAVALALGASRGTLARELFVESVLLAAIAGVAAILFAGAALPVVLSTVPGSIPRLHEAVVDFRVAVFAGAIAMFTALSCWIVPLLSLGDLRLERALRPGGRGAAAGLGSPARRLLVGTQVAAAVVLVTCAGLLSRSVHRLGEVDLGFDARNLIAVAMDVPSSLGGASAERVDQFYERALAELASLPGIETVAAATSRPLKGPIGLDSSWQFEGQSEDAADDNPWVNAESISSAYFRTMRTALREGRTFDERDRAGATPVVIVNERLARWAWPGESAIGKRLRTAALDGPDEEPIWWTVVGVAANVRYRELTSVPLDVYVPVAQSPFPAGDLMVRTRGPAAAAIPAIRSRLRAQSVDGVITVALMEQEVAVYEAPWRANLLFFQFFAGLTILLAAVGVYAMLDAGVVERSRDTGVRLALGATAWRVVAQVIADGGRVVLAGSAAGVVAAVTTARLMDAMLFEVSSLDTLTLSAAPLGVLAIGLAACLIPAVRASRLDPVVTLRAE
jgi:putative ABC transport system permease protein